MNLWFLALSSIALSVMAQFALKAGMSSTVVKQAMSGPLGLPTVVVVGSQPYVLLGFVCYGLGAVVWLKVLAAWDVSKAYPLVGLGFALTALIGVLMGESVTWERVLGVALICAGVWWIAKT